MMIDPLKEAYQAQGQLTPEEVEKRKKQQQEILEKRIKEAALIIETVETEGGKLLVQKICELMDHLDKPVEHFMTTDLTQQQCVDSYGIAYCAGGRSSLNELLRYLEEQKDIVIEEARKQSEKEK